MKLYIIRHGETSWNVQRRLKGASDTDLNENGITLAKRTGEALKKSLISLPSSPLKRAKMTAELIILQEEISLYMTMNVSGDFLWRMGRAGFRPLPAHMLDNFFPSYRGLRTRKAGRVSGKSAQGQRIFSRSLYAGKAAG